MFWRPSVLWVVIVALLLSTPANSAQQAGRGGPRLDYYGDPLPPGAVARLGTKRFQTKGGFDWTPDGKSLATLRGGTVYFWDLGDGHCRETLLVPISPDPFFTYGATFELSRDGKQLVCADFYGAIATWNLETSQSASEAATTKLRGDELSTVALHPGGKQFIKLRKDGDVQFRDLATCKVLRTVKLGGRWNDGTRAAFSPDGKTLVLTRGTSIFLLDAEKGEARPAIEMAAGYLLNHFEFLADGRLYSLGTRRGPAKAEDPQPRNQLLSWDVSQEPPTSREIALADDLPLAGCSAAFSADGKTLVTVASDRITIWDVAGARTIRTIEGSRFRNPSSALVRIDPTGKCVAVDDRQNYVRIWELATGKPVHSTEQHHQAGIYGADWSPDGSRVTTGAFDGEVRTWDAASGQPLARFRGPGWGVFALRHSPDATQVVVCGDEPLPGPLRVGGQVTGPVRWFDSASGKLVRETTLPSRARLLTPSPDWSQWAAVTLAVDDDVDTGPPAVRLLDAKTGAETGHINLEREHRETNALAWSADGRSLFVASSKKVTQFETATGKVQAESELPHLQQDFHTKLLAPGGFYRAAFLGHGAQIVTFGGLPEIYGWRLPAGERQWVLKSGEPDVRLLVPSRDERLLAVASIAEDKSAKLRVFDLDNRRQIATFDMGRDSAERAVFSPDGNRLLVGCIDGTALIYDLADLR